MTDNIIEFPNANTLHTVYSDEEDVPVPVDKLLAGLADREFDDIIVIGKQTNGVFFFATTSGNVAQINWDLEKAKQILLSTIALDIEDEY